MKTVFNIILAACVVGLLYLCYESIMGPIQFNKEKDAREEQIKARLIDIRKAQVEYRSLHGGRYTDSFDSLITFVKTAKLPFIKKEGVLSDDQLEAGMTEEKAMAMISKAKRTNNWKEVQAAGLMNFKRDTIWVAMVDTIYGRGYNADSLRYVPFGNGATFEMAIKEDSTKSGAKFYLFEAKTPYTAYLTGLNKQELDALIDMQTKLERFPGLKVGDIEVPNNNAGNWE